MIKNIKLNPYPFNLILVLNDKKTRIFNYCKKKFNQTIDEILDEDYSGITVRLDYNNFLIFIPSTDLGSYLYNVISHEVSHLVYQLLKDIGIDDDESQAYLIGYLTEIILNHVISYRKKE